MEELHHFLAAVRSGGLAVGRFRGLLHVLVGRHIARADGTVVSTGLTWRALAALLKKQRWDRDAVRELGIDPDDLPPRDRERYWYTAITRAGLGTAEARAEADALAAAAAELGYVIGPPPGGS